MTIPPRHLKFVKPFRISPYAVTNADFARFVNATGHKTTAEIPLDPDTALGMPPEYFAPGSLVFRMTDGPVDLRDFRQWWVFVAGACWCHPEGPGSSIDGRETHPVVQVSLFDAQAYAQWAELRLPNEAEWEFAARDGVDTTYPWGDNLNLGDELHANTWQGAFPWQNMRSPAAPFSVPVDALNPSRYGLYNMIGNVWEWTTDAYGAVHDPSKRCCTPARISEGANFVVKGGSFLCAPSYCQRYRAAARSPQEARSSTNHLGFRCVAP